MLVFLQNPDTYLGLITLTALEIILGIDNILFIGIICANLPKEQQELARRLGLSLALFGRLGLLFSLSWLLSLKEPLLTVFGCKFSIHAIVLGSGGLFLFYKATHELLINIKIKKTKTTASTRNIPSFKLAIIQIFILDLVFSLDSIITAIGLTTQLMIMAIAILIAVIIMLFAARYVSDFLEKNPSMKTLGLAFLLLIAVFLLADAFGKHIPRGYIYFALGFSIFVEFINIQNKSKD